MADPFRSQGFALEHPDPGSTRESADARDRRLLDGIRSGDQDALQALLDIYWAPLVRYGARLLASPDAAEDVAQEAFLRLWERRADWKPHRSARVLLYTIVRNLGLNRRKAVGTHARLLALHPLRESRSPATPAELAESNELDRAVERAIDGLPPRRREVLLLARYHDLSRAEIATLLGLSPQTVANHLALAIKELRRALAVFLPGSG